MRVRLTFEEAADNPRMHAGTTAANAKIAGYEVEYENDTNTVVVTLPTPERASMFFVNLAISFAEVSEEVL